jgi:hypothetical protein
LDDIGLEHRALTLPADLLQNLYLGNYGCAPVADCMIRNIMGVRQSLAIASAGELLVGGAGEKEDGSAYENTFCLLFDSDLRRGWSGEDSIEYRGRKSYEAVRADGVPRKRVVEWAILEQ